MLGGRSAGDGMDSTAMFIGTHASHPILLQSKEEGKLLLKIITEKKIQTSVHSEKRRFLGISK